MTVETLFDSRCPSCLWLGTTDDPVCPDCGYGLVNYEVVYEHD